MEDWTVIGSSEFDKILYHRFADFQAQLAAHVTAPNGRKAKRLLAAIAAYNHFYEKLKKLSDVSDQSVLPENELAYIQDDPKGVPIYSMIDGNWRCLFGVDTGMKTCTPVSVELMFDNLRIVEEDRHKNGKKLKSAR
jgi:hypothetical protein